MKFDLHKYIKNQNIVYVFCYIYRVRHKIT